MFGINEKDEITTCANCGVTISDSEQKYCTNCGNPLKLDAIAEREDDIAKVREATIVEIAEKLNQRPDIKKIVLEILKN